MSPVPHHNLTPQQANAVMRYNTRERWKDWVYDLSKKGNMTLCVAVADELQRLTEERDMWRTMYEESSV